MTRLTALTLEALREHGTQTAPEIALRLGVTYSGIQQCMMRARKAGYVESGRSSYRREADRIIGIPASHTITQPGRRALEEFKKPGAAKVVVSHRKRKAKGATIRECYEVSHAAHVELQRRAGIPKALIEAPVFAAWARSEEAA